MGAEWSTILTHPSFYENIIALPITVLEPNTIYLTHMTAISIKYNIVPKS